MKQKPSLLLLILVFASCIQEDSKTSAAHSIATIFEEYYQFKDRINPIEATKGGNFQYNDYIANYISDTYQRDLISEYTTFLERLAQIDSTQLSEADLLSMKVMQWDCEVKLEGLQNPLVITTSPIYNLPSFELTPLIQVQSLHLYVAQLGAGGSVHPFKTIKDYEDWLKRLDDYIAFLDTSIANMKEGMSKNIVLPKVLTEKTIVQLEEFITRPVDSHLFYRPIQQMPEAIAQSDRDRLSELYKNLIESRLRPKYIELKQFLVEEYLPVCRTTSGIGTLPNGEETYNYLIKLHTTTNLTADEIHTLGKREVARILEEMEEAKNQIGFKGDIKAFFEFIRNSPEQMPFLEPQGVIDNFNQIKERINDKFDKVFELKPKADFVVRRTEAFREASASAEYVPGTKDASRPGIFYVPIPNVSKYNKFADEALFLHEAIPGHHYQLSLQQENNTLPEFLHPESLGVFVEGWALYAESLGKELGLYDDPIQYFGMLSMEMHRAIRLVVDTGMHSKGWTREQAIQYSLDHEAESEASIISEIERYMATPGQALSYKMGQITIRALRTQAEDRLGAQFDVRAFHSQVLNSGSLPLVLLERKIENWITSQL
ncbi:DUF885 domain-containing protein [Flavobacteriaceae bacterium]|nr:DUF885 domain-containing protein [Flavobacteriaceae bacterium]MDA9852211.1 DUF885 domain-containing protein [Flavobacteriaceae bacterium]MDC0386187.1 DUF885 domain-containing protein [Flavobacteriaceae bacterium]